VGHSLKAPTKCRRIIGQSITNSDLTFNYPSNWYLNLFDGKIEQTELINAFSNPRRSGIVAQPSVRKSKAG